MFWRRNSKAQTTQIAGGIDLERSGEANLSLPSPKRARFVDRYLSVSLYYFVFLPMVLSYNWPNNNSEHNYKQG